LFLYLSYDEQSYFNRRRRTNAMQTPLVSL
jgi:hypothetical protein